jgi:3,5-epimerase/4-reductase
MVEEMKYLIFGNGWIGNKFAEYLGEEATLSTARIESINDAKTEIFKYNPLWVINCIGKTGKPNVDWCELHKDETLFGNVIVPLILLEACRDTGVQLLHIGTGCIYDGTNDGNGYTEEDDPNFAGSYYSNTKAFIERLLKEFDILQLRIRMPISEDLSERNLITKLLKYDNIIDIPNSITYVNDLLKVAKALMEDGARGIFNVVNPQPELHTEILNYYNKISPVYKQFKVISLEELDKTILAKRSNCVLSIKKLESFGLEMTPTNEVIKKCVDEYVRKQNEKQKIPNYALQAESNSFV